MSADPIDAVIARLDAIVAASVAEKSRAGYFAALYRRVTRTVRDQIGTGFFDDDARMESLDVTFAGRYLTAFEQWRAGDPAISQCWKVAFDAVDSRTEILLQHLLAGMNAHINFDLGIAAAEVAPSLEQLASLKGDFDRINCLLACLVPTVFTEIGDLSPLIHLLEEVDEPGEEKLVDLVMDVARDFAWIFAHELVVLRGVPDLQERLLAFKDREVSWIGEEVLAPGGLMGKLVHVVWVPESKDVRRNIEELAAPAALPQSCLEKCAQPARA